MRTYIFDMRTVDVVESDSGFSLDGRGVPEGDRSREGSWQAGDSSFGAFLKIDHNK